MSCPSPTCRGRGVQMMSNSETVCRGGGCGAFAPLLCRDIIYPVLPPPLAFINMPAAAFLFRSALQRETWRLVGSLIIHRHGACKCSVT